MDGSAAAVGRIMAAAAARAASPRSVARLGVAFQLTNFIRDVRVDYALDRIYLPGPGRGRPARRRTRAATCASASPRRSAARARCSPRPRASPPAWRRGCATACAVARARLPAACWTASSATATTSSARRVAPAAVGGRARAAAAPMTRRATKRGDERTSLDGTRADVLVCGASFAGLAVARELARSAAGRERAGRRPLRDRRAPDAAPARSRRRGCTRWASQAAAARGAARHDVHHAPRQRALPPALELDGVRLPHALPRAVGAVRRRRASRPRRSRGAPATSCTPTAATCTPR